VKFIKWKEWGVRVRLPVLCHIILVEGFRLNSVLDVYTRGYYWPKPAHDLRDIQVQIIFSEAAHIIFNKADFSNILYILI
jgi:hypothetical protein